MFLSCARARVPVFFSFRREILVNYTKNRIPFLESAKLELALQKVFKVIAQGLSKA